MTENNSDFIEESKVGNSGSENNIVKDIDHPSEESVVAENNIITNGNSDNLENENSQNTIRNEEKNSQLCNTGCENDLPSLQDHWLKLSTFFRKVYHSILDGEKPPNEYGRHVNIVRELVASDPHQLFARLEMDLQEFIIEIKLRQLELLNCVHAQEGPQLFIFCLIEGYNKLMFAAGTLSPLLLQLEKEHLKKFDISWKGLNRHLFHKLVFTELKVQKVIPLCISKLGKMNSKINSKLSDFNRKLIRQFLNFDGEMIQIGAKWREAESSIIRYHQENSMLDAKQRMMKADWELIKTQSKVFHEELKSSGISSNVSSDILSNHSVMNANNNDCSINLYNCDDDEKFSVDDNLIPFKTLMSTLKNLDADFDEQEVCESCHLDVSQCLGNSVPLNFEPNKGTKTFECLDNPVETLDEDTEILTHLNEEGKRMYSHLHKFKAQQSVNSEKNQYLESLDLSTKDLIKECLSLSEPSQKEQDVLIPASPSSPPNDFHKTAIRKQVIQQQRQQQQKKIMQMMQSPSQKNIQHKIQKQLQEHQFLLQQQRKIDELHAHLLQQHPIHMDKEMQKKMHLQMQQCLIQKHKQMEEKFHQQVQQHMQQHQENPSSPIPSAKSNKTVKESPCCPNTNHKCSNGVTPATSTFNAASKMNNNYVTSAGTRVPPSKSVITNANSAANVTHKNCTTQTTVTSIDGQNRAHHNPLPDVVKSASYVCPKHSEGSKPNMVHHFDLASESSDDDYSSERSNSPQRHCDCCYCEVFGSAPVRRNYQETRERLRSILNKKKAKSNAAANGNESKSTENEVASVAGNNCSAPLTASQGVGKVKKEDVRDKKSNPPAEYKGDRSIEEILDFIEGNKKANMKRTAKKMRRKQRQLEEEERRRKEEEEAERARLEELRRKEEEERRRQEEERRKLELLREQNRKKNKKKGVKPTNQSNAKSTLPSWTQGSKKAKNQNNALNERTKLTSNQNALRDQTCQKQAINQSLQKQQNYQAQKKQNYQTKQETQKQPQKQLQQRQQREQQQNKQKNVDSSKQPSQPAKKNVPKKGGGQPNQPAKGISETKDSNQPQMVTIKRVMQPNSNEPTVTITLRGPTPKDDKVLYTLLNGQMCQVKDDKNKKQSLANNTTNNCSIVGSSSINKKTRPPNNKTNSINSNVGFSGPGVNAHPMVAPKTANYGKTCGVVGNGVNSITERMERLKLGPLPLAQEQPKRMNVPSSSTQAELTTPTAIQINQAVNQLSSRPTFPNNFDLENIKLPPGITITKVDPTTVQRKPIQVKQQQPPHPSPHQTHVRQNMIPSVAGSSNVIVVDTVDKNNYYQSGEPATTACKKKRRKRKTNKDANGNDTATPAMPYGATNGLPPRMGPFGGGMFGSPFMNAAAGYGSVPQQPAAIIQMNGSMVTIRNPALHRAFGGPQMEYQDGTKMKKQNSDEKMLSSSPEDLENGDVDDYERELEAFKRFCSQSVPAESKAKVNLNIEDIVLKKKGPVIGCS